MPNETPEQALALAKGAARFNQYELTAHAVRQMSARNADRRDLNRAIATATHTLWDQSNESWKLMGGNDCSGSLLEPAVVFSGHVMTVKTVMG